MPQPTKLLKLAKAVQLGEHDLYENMLTASYLPHRYYFLVNYVFENQLEEWVKVDNSGSLSIVLSSFEDFAESHNSTPIDLDVIALALKLNGKRKSTGVWMKLYVVRDEIEMILDTLTKYKIKSEIVWKTKTLKILDPVGLFMNESIDHGIYAIATVYELLTQSETERLLYHFLKNPRGRVIL